VRFDACDSLLSSYMEERELDYEDGEESNNSNNNNDNNNNNN
jgi:hypothetical protein